MAKELSIVSEQELPVLIRFDRMLAFNSADFIDTFEEDGQTIFDIMVFIAFTYQHNLFNFGKFTISDFCKVMHYQKSNLIARHKEPLYVKKNKHLAKQIEGILKSGNYKTTVDNNGKKELIYYTVFDNALYKAAKENLELTHVNNKNNALSVTTNFYKLFDSIEKRYDKKGQVLYTYKVSSDFENNISKLFFNIDLTDYVNLPKSLKPLYLLMKTLKDGQLSETNSIVSANFDLLCRAAGINSGEIKDKNKRLKVKLSKINKSTDLKFNILNGPYDLAYKFKYHEDIKKLKQIGKSSVEKAAYDRTLIDLRRYYRDYVGKQSSVGQKEWIADLNASRDLKIKTFVKNFSALAFQINEKHDKVKEFLMYLESIS